MLKVVVMELVTASGSCSDTGEVIGISRCSGTSEVSGVKVEKVIVVEKLMKLLPLVVREVMKNVVVDLVTASGSCSDIGEVIGRAEEVKVIRSSCVISGGVSSSGICDSCIEMVVFEVVE
ncbi:hypothetical protein ACROYT_G034940 [Oculina patagonica]